MATIVGLPKLSPTMEEGVLAKWHRKEGDKINPGDVIAEVETDKANMDFPLEDEGTLLKLLVKEGDTVKLGAPVAIVGEPGEDISQLEKQAREISPQGEPEREREPEPAPPPAAPTPLPAGPSVPTGNGETGGRLLASPIAKTLAAEHGLDLRQIKGTGPGGRIVERDVRAAIEGGAPAPIPTPVPAPAPGAPAPKARPPVTPIVPDGEEFLDKSLSMMRKTIARRMTEAKQTVPHFYLTSDIDAGPLVAFHEHIRAAAGEEAKISINDLIVKGCALALRRVPAANASFLGDRIRYHGRVHISVAVALDEGLVTPVVRDADRKGIAAISAEIKELAARARARKLQPDEMTGGTFSVSNLGMFGIDTFQAVINPPEGCILAVGRIRREPVVSGESIAIGHRLALTLSCDHRVVDGAVGAQYLKSLVGILERPAALAL
jgi:pyruvate dehydrogenase E2 component (dihydrolipoamide acetyltransferase)